MKSLMILKRKFVLLIPIAVYTSKWKSLAKAVFLWGKQVLGSDRGQTLILLCSLREPNSPPPPPSKFYRLGKLDNCSGSDFF